MATYCPLSYWRHLLTSIECSPLISWQLRCCIPFWRSLLPLSGQWVTDTHIHTQFVPIMECFQMELQPKETLLCPSSTLTLYLTVAPPLDSSHCLNFLPLYFKWSYQPTTYILDGWMWLIHMHEVYTCQCSLITLSSTTFLTRVVAVYVPRAHKSSYALLMCPAASFIAGAQAHTTPYNICRCIWWAMEPRVKHSYTYIYVHRKFND